MIANWDLSRSQLLVIFSATIEPLKRCSDGRWRSANRLFPSEGLSDYDVEVVSAFELVQAGPQGVSLTESGRALLSVGAPYPTPTGVQLRVQ